MYFVIMIELICFDSLEKLEEDIPIIQQSNVPSQPGYLIKILFNGS